MRGGGEYEGGGKRGRKEGRGGEKERKEERGKARQLEWTLPMASRSLCQVPMKGRAAPVQGPREGQIGQPARSASASSRRLWQRSKIPGLLGP